jgi:hypothetical protein
MAFLKWSALVNSLRTDPEKRLAIINNFPNDSLPAKA